MSPTKSVGAGAVGFRFLGLFFGRGFFADFVRIGGGVGRLRGVGAGSDDFYRFIIVQKALSDLKSMFISIKTWSNAAMYFKF